MPSRLGRFAGDQVGTGDRLVSGAKVERAMKRAEKIQQKELKADTAEIERDAASAT